MDLCRGVLAFDLSLLTFLSVLGDHSFLMALCLGVIWALCVYVCVYMCVRVCVWFENGKIKLWRRRWVWREGRGRMC